MALSKRELRKISTRLLSVSPDSGLLFIKGIEYLVTTTIKIVEHHKVLVLYVYSCEKAKAGDFSPAYTLFQGKDDFITMQHTDGGKKEWRAARVDHLGGSYINFTPKCAFLSNMDQQRVTKFCRVKERTGLDALSYRQERIREERKRQKQICKEREIIHKMASVPALPPGFMRWAKRYIVPHYIFYNYHRSKRPMDGRCSGCGHAVQVSDARHNKKGKCPKCKRPITYKAIGRSTRVWERVTTQVLLRISEYEYVIRVYKVDSWYRDTQKIHGDLYEQLRIFLHFSESTGMLTEYYHCGYGILTDWKPGLKPQFSWWQYDFDNEPHGFLYTGNLEAVFKGTPWQYCPIERFVQIDKEPLELAPFLEGCRKYLSVEYLIKFGLTRLASEIIYGRPDSETISPYGKNIRQVLHVEPQDIPILCSMNATIEQLRLMQQMRKIGKPCGEKLLRWFGTCDTLHSKELVSLLKKMSIKRLTRYIDEQYAQLKSVVVNWQQRRYETKGRVISEYADYLNMCELLGYNMKSKFIRYPRNLMEAHDRTMRVLEDKKTAIYSAKIEQMYQQLRHQYAFTAAGLAVIPPKTVDEIVSEGHTLHHCVGGYVDRVAKGKCIILFVRKLDDLGTPFYTLEIRDGKVSELRGQSNCSPSKDVEKFMLMWEAKKLAPHVVASLAA